MQPRQRFYSGRKPLTCGPPGSTAAYAAVSPNATGNPRQTGFLGMYGAVNECSINAYNSLLPETHRTGLLAQGNYNLSANAELFSELLLSYVQELNRLPPPGLSGDPRFLFSQFTVPASNAFNPFGESVGVSELFTNSGASSYPLDTLFARVLMGARGDFGANGKWEVAAWDSRDYSTSQVTNTADPVGVQNALNSTDPATALNPFTAWPPASSPSLQSPRCARPPP